LVDVSISSIGFTVLILGIILAFVAVILIAARAVSSPGRTRGGGVLLIGPFPIVFGTDRESAKILMVLAIILIAVVLFFMVLPLFILNQ